MAQAPGSYVLISLTIDDSSGTRKLTVGYTMMAFMQNDTTPVISTYPGKGDIVLPNGSNRPFAFVIRYDGGSSTGYIWNSDPTQCLAISDAGTVPVFGGRLPAGFTGPTNNGGGEVCFIDANNAPKKQYEYRIQLIADPNGRFGGSPPLVLDPKITNGGVNI